MKCLKCGRNANHKAPNGAFYCDDCFEEYFFRCERCNNLKSTTHERSSPDGEKLCATCFDNECVYCHNCDRPSWKNKVKRVPDFYEESCYNDDNNLFCEECISNKKRNLKQRLNNLSSLG